MKNVKYDVWYFDLLFPTLNVNSLVFSNGQPSLFTPSDAEYFLYWYWIFTAILTNTLTNYSFDYCLVSQVWNWLFYIFLYLRSNVNVNSQINCQIEASHIIKMFFMPMARIATFLERWSQIFNEWYSQL